MSRAGIDPVSHIPANNAAFNGRPWPRGFRNGNPGNIDWHPHHPWQGLATPPREIGVTAPRFARFTAAAWGIRAILRLLVTYKDKHDIRTIRGIISRWAPTSENNTDAYVRAVCKATGRHEDLLLDAHFREDALPVARAIVEHELGSAKAYGLNEWYPDDVWDRAATMAGLQRRKPAPIVQDRDIAAGGAATLLAGVSAADAMGFASKYVEPGSIAAQAISMLAVVAVVYLVTRALRRRKADAA